MRRRRTDTVRAYRDAFTERDRIFELDALVARAWPALTVVDLDGWRVRTSRGLGRVGNSVWPRQAGSRLDVATKVANVERHYAERRLPAVFMVGPAAEPKGLDRVLDERGYERSAPVEVRTARVNDLAWPAEETPPEVVLLDEPTPRWLEAWERVGGHPAGTAALAGRMLGRVPAPSVYALLHVRGADVAVARGVLDGGWFGLAEIATAPDRRHDGAARLLCASLAARADAAGAELAWTAVRQAGGGGAWARETGFRPTYSYRYRTRALQRRT